MGSIFLSLECDIQILKIFNAIFTQNSELLNLNTRKENSVIQMNPLFKGLLFKSLLNTWFTTIFDDKEPLPPSVTLKC